MASCWSTGAPTCCADAGEKNASAPIPFIEGRLPGIGNYLRYLTIRLRRIAPAVVLKNGLAPYRCIRERHTSANRVINQKAGIRRSNFVQHLAVVRGALVE